MHLYVVLQKLDHETQKNVSIIFPKPFPLTIEGWAMHDLPILHIVSSETLMSTVITAHRHPSSMYTIFQHLYDMLQYELYSLLFAAACNAHLKR